MIESGSSTSICFKVSSKINIIPKMCLLVLYLHGNSIQNVTRCGTVALSVLVVFF